MKVMSPEVTQKSVPIVIVHVSNPVSINIMFRNIDIFF